MLDVVAVVVGGAAIDGCGLVVTSTSCVSSSSMSIISTSLGETSLEISSSMEL